MATYSRGLTIDARSVVNNSQGSLGNGVDHTIYTVPSERVLRLSYLFIAGQSDGLGGGSVVGDLKVDGLVVGSYTSGGAASNLTIYSTTFALGPTHIEFGPGAVLTLNNTSTATLRNVYWRWNGVLYAIG